MALQKNWYNLFWFTTDLYVKIPWIEYIESWVDKDWKLYDCKFLIDIFTNETKQYKVEQKHWNVKNLRIEQCNLEYLYSELKKQEDFKTFLDV